MQRAETLTLQKIIGYCDDIDPLLSQFQHDFQCFRTEIAFQYACNMCIIQIGELVSRLPEEFTLTHPEIPWRAITGMRNLHALDYDSVKLEIVWQTLTEEIPALRAQIQCLL